MKKTLLTILISTFLLTSCSNGTNKDIKSPFATDTPPTGSNESIKIER